MSRMDSFMNLSPLNTTVSWKVILFSDISAVNFMVGWNELASSGAISHGDGQIFTFIDLMRWPHDSNLTLNV